MEIPPEDIYGLPEKFMTNLAKDISSSRIEGIMANRFGRRLDFGNRLLLATVATLAVAAPIAVGGMITPRVQAQSPPAARPVFDVASVRPSDPNERGDWVHFPPGRLEVRNAPLIFVIQQIYGVRDFQIVGAPKWIVDRNTARFDINAKAEGVTDEGHLRLMAQNLLEDRFRLKLHRETRDLPVYLLTQAKNGVRVKVAPDDGSPRGSGAIEFVVPGQLQGENVAMDQLAKVLSRYADRPVLNKTNYTEAFTFNLEWAPDDSQPDDVRPSLLAAVQKQMGLKLDPRKAPIDVLVIDRIERPSEN